MASGRESRTFRHREHVTEVCSSCVALWVSATGRFLPPSVHCSAAVAVRRAAHARCPGASIRSAVEVERSQAADSVVAPSADEQQSVFARSLDELSALAEDHVALVVSSSATTLVTIAAIWQVILAP